MWLEFKCNYQVQLWMPSLIWPFSCFFVLRLCAVSMHESLCPLHLCMNFVILGEMSSHCLYTLESCHYFGA